MFFSLIIRYERIITFFKTDLRKFYNKRHFLQEKFYVRILIIFFIVFLAFLIILNMITNKCFEILNLSNLEDYLIDNNDDKNKIKSQIYTWVI